LYLLINGNIFVIVQYYYVYYDSGNSHFNIFFFWRELAQLCFKTVLKVTIYLIGLKSELSLAPLY